MIIIPVFSKIFRLSYKPLNITLPILFIVSLFIVLKQKIIIYWLLNIFKIYSHVIFLINLYPYSNWLIVWRLSRIVSGPNNDSWDILLLSNLCEEEKQKCIKIGFNMCMYSKYKPLNFLGGQLKSPASGHTTVRSSTRLHVYDIKTEKESKSNENLNLSLSSHHSVGNLPKCT